MNMPVGACGTAPILQTLDALVLFRNTCRHRALNPLSVPRCVRSAVERRCWRISRNAILQGGNRGAIWGQRGGNVWTVEHFTFLEAESEDLCPRWERGRAEEDRRNDGESDGRRLTRCDHTGGLNEIITSRCYSQRKKCEQDSLGDKRETCTPLLFEMRGLLLDSGCSSEIYSWCLGEKTFKCLQIFHLETQSFTRAYRFTRIIYLFGNSS